MASPDPEKRAIVLAVAGGMALLGLFMALPGAWWVIQAQASTSWPTADGKVLRSEVRTQRTGNTSSHEPLVIYQYQVEGKSYRRDRPTISRQPSKTTAPAEEVVARYPVGTQVTVYYDAADPATSVLEPGVTLRTAALLLAGMAFLGFGGLCYALRDHVR